MQYAAEDGRFDADVGNNSASQTAPTQSRPEISTTELSQELQCVHRYRAQAYRKEDPLAAAIAVANSNLLEYEVHVSDALRKLIAAQPLTIENLYVIAPAIDNIARLMKLVNQAAQLEIQLEKPHRANRSATGLR